MSPVRPPWSPRETIIYIIVYYSGTIYIYVYIYICIYIYVYIYTIIIYYYNILL